MKYLKLSILVLIGAVIYTGCDNVNNDYDIDSTAQAGYVEVSDTLASVSEGSSGEVEFRLPISQREDVTFTFSITGDAIKGTDWTTPDGNVTDQGGSGTITYIPDTTSTDLTTIDLTFPKDQVKDGQKTLTITLTGAETASGETLNVGQGPNNVSKTFKIADFDFVTQIPTGPYNYALSGAFGSGSGTVSISQPASPVVVDGIEYAYVLSSSAPGIFGGAVPYPFSIRGKGDGVFIAPTDYVQAGLYQAVSGSYSGSTGTITVTETLFCCGLTAPAQFSLALTPQ